MALPTYTYRIGMKPGSDNTVIVARDEGWQISVRIRSRVERAAVYQRGKAQMDEMDTERLLPKEPINAMKFHLDSRKKLIG